MAQIIRVAALTISITLLVSCSAQPTLLDVGFDIYDTCWRHFSFGCAKPKALKWYDTVLNDNVINISEDLAIVKTADVKLNEDQRAKREIYDKFEDFLQTHQLIVKVPQILRADGPLGGLIPRSFQPQDLAVPLASTGRSSKIVKKVILPFLLGLKFKTAVLVPLALTLIALKSWKALTLGLLSLVLTAAMVIFKFTKPKVVNYEVVHYPHHLDHHHFDHHEHHLDHVPVASGWDHGYARQMNANELAYNAYVTKD